MASQESATPIVRKIEESSDPDEHGSSLNPVQKREIVLRLEAESLDNMRKRATVRVDQPKGSTFEIICDEGPYLDGDDSAPPALAYYSASIAFCLLTQLSRYVKVKNLNIRSMKLAQETRFAMEGSVIKGTLAGRGVEVVTHLDIESDEPEDVLRQMIEVGKNSCFIHQSIMNPVPSTIQAKVNGQLLG